MSFDGMPQPWLWGYFLPVGLLLLTWGGLPPHKARRVTPVAALALALAVLGYWAVGFAFHLGGAQAVRPDDPALSGLQVLFPLVPRDVGWGFVGLSGFFLSGPEITPAVLGLFLAYLPLMAAAVLLVTLALADTRRWLMVTAGALAGTLVFPVAACWMWGGGWLAHLGDTLALGHGFVDFGGGALVLWLPGALALGILLFQPRHTPEDPPAPPPAYFPLLANLGVLLMGIGWIGWTLSAPFHTGGATWDWNRAALSALLGMAGATLTAQLYAWLVTGELESLLAARGLAAGWGAALAAAPFVPPWAALVIGLLGGLLFSFCPVPHERCHALAGCGSDGRLGPGRGIVGPAQRRFLCGRARRAGLERGNGNRRCRRCDRRLLWRRCRPVDGAARGHRGGGPLGTTVGRVARFAGQPPSVPAQARAGS